MDAALDSYFEQLYARLDSFGDAGALAQVRTVYTGGGTPSLAGERLVELARRISMWCKPVEFTCEANPESLTAELASALAEAGVTRISLGVQTLDNTELAAIGRIHDANRALAAIATVKDAGLDASCDLMCGLPGQTAASWRSTLDGVLAAAPHHVSVYPLTLEEGTPLYRMACRDESLEPDEDFQAACMDVARQRLSSAGYHPYEVASYALDGHECAHNIAYWTGRGYLGLGRSAAGMLDDEDFDRLAGLFPGVAPRGDFHRVRLVQRDDAATMFDAEYLSRREAAAEDLMLACRAVLIPTCWFARLVSSLPMNWQRLVIALLSLGLPLGCPSTVIPMRGLSPLSMSSLAAPVPVWRRPIWAGSMEMFCSSCFGI